MTALGGVVDLSRSRRIDASIENQRQVPDARHRHAGERGTWKVSPVAHQLTWFISVESTPGRRLHRPEVSNVGVFA